MKRLMVVLLAALAATLVGGGPARADRAGMEGFWESSTGARIQVPALTGERDFKILADLGGGSYLNMTGIWDEGSDTRFIYMTDHLERIEATFEGETVRLRSRKGSWQGSWSRSRPAPGEVRYEDLPEHVRSPVAFRNVAGTWKSSTGAVIRIAPYGLKRDFTLAVKTADGSSLRYRARWQVGFRQAFEYTAGDGKVVTGVVDREGRHITLASKGSDWSGTWVKQ